LSEESKVNGEMFAVGGGRIARVTFAESEGVFDAGESIEAVREAMPTVLAATGWTYPPDLAARTIKVSELFGQDVG